MTMKKQPNYMLIGERKIPAELGPIIYPEFGWDPVHKALTLCMARRTQFDNIIWLRVIRFYFHWPFFRTSGCFRTTDENATEVS